MFSWEKGFTTDRCHINVFEVVKKKKRVVLFIFPNDGSCQLLINMTNISCTWKWLTGSFFCINADLLMPYSSSLHLFRHHHEELMAAEQNNDDVDTVKYAKKRRMEENNSDSSSHHRERRGRSCMIK